MAVQKLERELIWCYYGVKKSSLLSSSSQCIFVWNGKKKKGEQQTLFWNPYQQRKRSTFRQNCYYRHLTKQELIISSSQKVGEAWTNQARQSAKVIEYFSLSKDKGQKVPENGLHFLCNIPCNLLGGGQQGRGIYQSFQKQVNIMGKSDHDDHLLHYFRYSEDEAVVWGLEFEMHLTTASAIGGQGIGIGKGGDGVGVLLLHSK